MTIPLGATHDAYQRAPTIDSTLIIDALHQYAYCPRRMHLMHVEGLMAHNAFTEDGSWVHRRVDAVDEVLPISGGDEPPTVVRSVTLTDDALGLTGKLDLAELEPGDPIPPTDDGLTGPQAAPNAPRAVPVETKRGKVPDNAERSWEPERVQLMAQGLLLRAHGYRCDAGVLYFAASRTRVPIAFTADLEARTLHLLAQAQSASRATRLPPPLVDSPKCHGCSLAGICLPDETAALAAVPADPAAPEVRRLYPARDDAQPLYVQEQGAVVGKTGEGLHITKGGAKLAEVRLRDVSQLVLCGRITLTTAALQVCCEAGIPIVHLSQGHWFHGITGGFTLKNAYDRAAQYATANDPARCLAIAKAIVSAKGQNQRTLLRRNAEPAPHEALQLMARLMPKVEDCADLGSLLGIEGNLAAAYFSGFSAMLRPKDGPSPGFDLNGRNRRPPKDPVNACLSFAYAILVKECTVALAGVGLDPFWGLYHQPRHGRPALALDLMEEFRPLIADSAVITAINTGMLGPADFVTGANACALTTDGRKALIRAIEARLDQLATHPIFDYRCAWRSIIRLQAQLLARTLRGELAAYPGITTR
jgi:CRISPR-associated protein Cas1